MAKNALVGIDPHNWCTEDHAGDLGNAHIGDLEIRGCSIPVHLLGEVLELFLSRLVEQEPCRKPAKAGFFKEAAT